MVSPPRKVAAALKPIYTAPTEQAARAKERGTPRDKRKAAGRLVEGATVQGWKAALGQLALAYPTDSTPTSTNRHIDLHTQKP